MVKEIGLTRYHDCNRKEHLWRREYCQYEKDDTGVDDKTVT
jgi:hypothetical protein